MRFGELPGPEACCAKCQAYIPQCKVWTWLKEGGECWIKGEEPTRTQHRDGATSGKVTRTDASAATGHEAADGPDEPAGAAEPAGAEADGGPDEGDEADAAGPPAAEDGRCALSEENIKYTTQGNWSLKVEDVADGAACCEECRQDERCELWTWVRALLPNKAGACWLKSGEVQRKVWLLGFVSGLPDRGRPTSPPASPQNSSAPEDNVTTTAAGGVGFDGACADPDVGCKPGQYYCLEGFSKGGCSDDEFSDPDDCARYCKEDNASDAPPDAPDAYRGECEDDGPCKPGDFHCLAGGDDGPGCVEPSAFRQYNLEHECTQYCMTPDRTTTTTTARRGGHPKANKSTSRAHATAKAKEGAFAGDCEKATSCAEGQYFCLKGVSKDGCSPSGDKGFFNVSHGCKQFCLVVPRPTKSTTSTAAPADTSASPSDSAEASDGDSADSDAAPAAVLVARRMFRAGGGDLPDQEDGACDKAAICSDAQDYCAAGLFEGICSPRGSLDDEKVCTRYCAVVEDLAPQQQGAQDGDDEPPAEEQQEATVSRQPQKEEGEDDTAAAEQTPAPTAENESGSDAGANASANASASEAAAPPPRSVVKGICYTPVPAKAAPDAPGASYGSSDYTSRNASKMWSSDGRGDLGVIAALGASAVRVYGNDPAADHGPFLEQARQAGLQVIAGLPDFPYSQAQENCKATGFNCFAQAKELHKQNLRSGFLTEDSEYHESLRMLVLLNEPDQGFRQHGATTVELYRAAISALDGVLDAEAEVGIVGAPPNITVTFSFAMCRSCAYLGDRPGLGQMAELRGALQSPDRYGYQPKHDLWEAYQQRFVNSVSTANSAADFSKIFLGAYDENFQGVPLLIGEYHAQNLWVDQGSDLEAILEVAASGESMLTGILFYEFQVRYDLKDKDLEFGIFGLGDKAIAKFNFGASIYSSWCLEPVRQEGSESLLFKAVQQAFGGSGLRRSQLCEGSGLSDEELEHEASNTSDEEASNTSDEAAARPHGEPVTTMRGFMVLSANASAGLQEDLVASAVQATMSVWLNLSAAQVGISAHRTSSPTAPSEEWQASYRIDVPDSRYPYVKLVSDAIVQQPDAFKETLRQQLVEGGVDEADLGAGALGVSEFTGLQGPEPTSTWTTTTTALTATQTTTTTRPWTKLTGFMSIVATEATAEQLEKVVRSSLGMRLNVPEGRISEVSVFPEDRRLLSVDGMQSPAHSHTWDASYVIMAYDDDEVEGAKNLAHFISQDPATFVSTMRGLLKQKGLQDSSLTPEALNVVVFSELLGGDTTTSATATTSARAPLQDVSLDDSMAEPDVGVLDGAGGEPRAGLQTDSVAFDCHDGEAVWTSGWSEVKISWCCEHEQVGCEALTSSEPYDCQAGLSRWERGWSASKMDWCCRHRELGCSTTAPADKFDCNAGYDHWQQGWSESKTSWCCENKRLGCDPNEEGPDLA